MKLIQVYNDIGSGSFAINQLLKALNTVSDKFEVIQTNGELLRSRHRLHETALLCFGGGYDLGFLSSLKPEGCAIVRDYIQSGGKYLGLCAGAYFASSRCVFDENGPLEVVGDRSIGLFEGDAVGPHFPGFEYNSEKGSYAMPVVRADIGSTNASVPAALAYFNGGCTFRSAEWKNSTVLYNYGNLTDPAIILSRLGKGMGILSGVHVEYDPDDVDSLNAGAHSRSVASQLKVDNANRLRLWNELLSILLSLDNRECTDFFSRSIGTKLL